MSALEDLKDKLQDQFSELKNRIQESSTYNSLRERYENLTPNAQQGLMLGGIAAAIIFFCYIPYSYFSSSSTYVSEFNEKRGIIRQLLRASRLATQAGSVSNPPDISTLQSSITARLSQFNLLPEQNAGINPVEAAALGGSFAPPGIIQEGLALNLKQLNLKQIVDIGYDLQNLAQGVRLVGMSMTPTQKDRRYFDVVYQIARFSMPGAGESAPSAAITPPTGGSRPANAPRNRFNPPPNTQNSGATQAPANNQPPPQFDQNAPPTDGGDEQFGDPGEFEGE